MKIKKTETVTLNMVIRPDDQSITAKEFEAILRKKLEDAGIKVTQMECVKSIVRKSS